MIIYVFILLEQDSAFSPWNLVRGGVIRVNGEPKTKFVYFVSNKVLIQGHFKNAGAENGFMEVCFENIVFTFGYYLFGKPKKIVQYDFFLTGILITDCVFNC